jgi:hypothetical protein
MKIIPCDDCKRQATCQVPYFLKQNSHLGVFQLADKIVDMEILVSITFMDQKKEEVVLECNAVSLIPEREKKETYSALLNSKQQDDDCGHIGRALMDKCKKGDCGGCGGH